MAGGYYSVCIVWTTGRAFDLYSNHSTNIIHTGMYVRTSDVENRLELEERNSEIGKGKKMLRTLWISYSSEAIPPITQKNKKEMVI